MTGKQYIRYNVLKWGLILLLILIIILFSAIARAQLIGELDETRLYAESKQVNQFFRRFNGEEDEKGNRYYPGDKQYRNMKLRKKYMSILFNEGNTGLDPLKKEFAEDVLNKSKIIDFHGGNWFAEVQALFQVGGKDQSVTLYMELERSHLGHKWVISKMRAPWLDPYYSKDTVRVGRFLHPMSHELDFMNLRKAFANADSVSQFTSREFKPDHLSVVLYETRRGNIKFKSVESVRFHFFQVDGWYFEVADFNRPGYNTGWLISNLTKLNNTSERELLKRYLYNEAK
ncbi:hypothetical protein WSM22_35220 [Cytophagales bacterium WSM2-2]|nr:hypothetical protein WSM22_35220 [Cytophagales bacterium WSM2-2]